MKTRLLPFALVVALGLVACGGSAGVSEQISGEDVIVRMFDNRFEFTEIRVPIGGSVTWLGAGRNPHNVVAVDGSWSTEAVFGSLEQFQGDLAVITYNQPGEYPFFCIFHGNADGEGMAGTIIVGGDGD